VEGDIFSWICYWYIFRKVFKTDKLIWITNYTIKNKYLQLYLQREVWCWNRLPSVVVDALSLNAFKVRLDKAMGNMIQLWCPCSLQGSWTRWPSEVPSNSKDSMIVWSKSPALAAWRREFWAGIKHRFGLWYGGGWVELEAEEISVGWRWRLCKQEQIAATSNVLLESWVRLLCEVHSSLSQSAARPRTLRAMETLYQG